MRGACGHHHHKSLGIPLALCLQPVLHYTCRLAACPPKIVIVELPKYCIQCHLALKEVSTFCGKASGTLCAFWAPFRQGQMSDRYAHRGRHAKPVKGTWHRLDQSMKSIAPPKKDHVHAQLDSVFRRVTNTAKARFLLMMHVPRNSSWCRTPHLRRQPPLKTPEAQQAPVGSGCTWS